MAAIPRLGCQCGVGWGGWAPSHPPLENRVLGAEEPEGSVASPGAMHCGEGGLLCPHITGSTLCGCVRHMRRLPPDPHK